MCVRCVVQKWKKREDLEVRKHFGRSYRANGNRIWWKKKLKRRREWERSQRERVRKRGRERYIKRKRKKTLKKKSIEDWTFLSKLKDYINNIYFCTQSRNYVIVCSHCIIWSMIIDKTLVRTLIISHTPLHHYITARNQQPRTDMIKSISSSMSTSDAQLLFESLQLNESLPFCISTILPDIVFRILLDAHRRLNVILIINCYYYYTFTTTIIVRLLISTSYHYRNCHNDSR